MRLKDICELNPSYVGDSVDEVSFVPMECLRYDKIIPQSISFKEAIGKYTAFADGDILMAKVTPCFENGNLAIASDLENGIGFGSSEIFVLRVNKKVNNRFLFYFIQSQKFREEACSTMCGVGGLKRIQPLFMRTYELDLPNKSIQEKIVSYLDKETEEIDQKIGLLNRQREAYERLKKTTINHVVTRGLDPNVQLKNPNLPFIGQIPKDWEVKRVKDICTYVSRGTTPDYVYESPFKVMNQATFSKGYIDSSLIRFTASGSKDAQIIYGDLLMASTGGGVLGKLLYFDSTDSSFYADSHVTILRNSKNPLITKFLFFYFSTRYEEINQTLVKGSTNQTELQRNYLLNYELPLPRTEELLAIVDYLEKRLSAINVKIETINKLIDAYKRLKRSLINEVITGKRKI